MPMQSVLIIEDDEKLQKMYQQELESFAIKVFLAIDGKNGLIQAQTLKPNLVLLDIMLPGGMNGFDVLEALKNDPKTKNIPVIVLTNLDTEKKTAMDIGADDYLVKVNTRPGVVLEKIKQLLAKQIS